VRPRPEAARIGVGEALLGRLVDAFARPLDGGPPIAADAWVPVDAPAPPVHRRAPVRQPFVTGVRAIDGLVPCGRGQRTGIFAGAGVGKSMLVEQIAAHGAADVVVLGLVGERGREVRELLAAGWRSATVVVAATADRSPLERVRGARTATAIAEYFRDRGADVLLVIDSLTRYAMALREIGLLSGEPPATKGYPPSVFAELPRLVERVAPLEQGGAITGFYTVLVEGDDLADPVADAARALLDGHVVLSRELASRGQFPAVDLVASGSRAARRVCSDEQQQLVELARELLAQRQLVRELQSLGAYTPGLVPAHDRALALGERLDAWARQPAGQASAPEETLAGLRAALAPAGPAAGHRS
jgi:flagellum-specific ATP synthase